MACVHGKECGAATFCDLDNDLCIGMFPEHEQTDCQYYERPGQKEEEEYLDSLTEADLKNIVEEAAQ